MYALFRPLLFHIDPERAHSIASGAARLVQAISPAIVRPLYAYEHPCLEQKLWGRTFSNPVGLAAGFDKNAQLVRFWQHAGFGFCEIGSVSARASEGNPKPRAFRLPADRALVNRLGLNNEGAEEVSRRLKKLPLEQLLPVGVNIAKTHDPDVVGEGALLDFRHTFRLMAGYAAYVVLNISCPNTREGKTFEDPASLDELLTAITADKKDMKSDVPILIKLSPTFSQHVVFDSAIEEIVSIARSHGIQGFVATNTASDRTDLKTPGDVLMQIGAGGLSGAPLSLRTTRLIKYLFERTERGIPIIAVGGIDSAETAYANLRAGASLVQLYTGLVYRGLGVVKKIKKGLVRMMREDGFSSLADVIGVDSKLPPSPVSEEVLESIAA